MTPQEKLIALREKFLFILLQAGATETAESTKQCVDVFVDEILGIAEDNRFTTGRNQLSDKEYWQQVKEENEKS